MAADAKAKAEELIRQNAVMVFSKTWCPSCKRSKRILEEKRQEYEAKGHPFTLDVYELDEASDGEEIQDYLGHKTGARTVPRIFVATETLGGGDDLVAAMAPEAPRSLDSHWLEKAVDYTAAHAQHHPE